MIKLIYFVEEGNYQETKYFHTEQQAKNWAYKYADKIISLEAVSMADYMEWLGRCD